MLISLIRGLLGGQQEHPLATISPAVDSKPADAPKPAESPSIESASPTPAKPGRRAPTLRAAGVGSVAQRRALRSVGVLTTEDLLRTDAASLVQRLQWPAVAERRVRRWQRAIRMARTIRSMTPRDALMLRGIHRRSVRAVASDSAPRLYRDLKRYALSSRGAKQLADHPLPSLEQVRRWIDEAQQRGSVSKP